MPTTTKAALKNAAKYDTREAYLKAAIGLVTAEFAEEFASVFPGGIPEKIMVSCGFPLRERGGKVIGQCWPTATSGDQSTHHIFITPRITESIPVLATLLHELVHAADNNEHKHRGPFVKCVQALGLAGKPTATYAEQDSELHHRLSKLAKELGPYPHTDLQPITISVQKTYQRLVQCEDCGCKVRMTQKWLEEAGTPTCGCGGYMEVEDK